MVHPVGSRCICLQREHELFAVDPTTGESLWVRRSLPRGCRFWGDDELLFVEAPDRSAMYVLRTADGARLEHWTRAEDIARVPPLLQRMSTIGRRVLAWKNIDRGLHLTLVDPRTGRSDWKLPIQFGSKAQVLDDRAVAVMEPSGRFRIVDIPTGSAAVDQTLLPEQDPPVRAGQVGQSRLQTIHVMSTPDGYLLFTNRLARSGSLTRGKSRISSPESGSDVFAGTRSPLVSGRLYALDRHSGRPRWQVPAEIADFALPLSQPAALPVVMLLRHETEANNRSVRNEVSTSLLFLDRRTGCIVDEQTLEKTAAYNYELTGDPKEHTVTLSLSRESITLQFTDGPIAPEPPAQRTDKRKDERGIVGRLLDGFRRGLEREAQERLDDD
jgi:outer membrane protein assembly factor BamB